MNYATIAAAVASAKAKTEDPVNPEEDNENPGQE